MMRYSCRPGLLLLALLALSSAAFATIDAYDFRNVEDEQRFRHLVEELRCPKCQNQNIADSNAGLAKDIKDRVYRLINEGKPNREIVEYMVDRYGDFITYRPPLRPVTWFLWFGPLILAFSAALFIFIRKFRQKTASAVLVSADQHAQVQALLKQLDQTDKPQ